MQKLESILSIRAHKAAWSASWMMIDGSLLFSQEETRSTRELPKRLEVLCWARATVLGSIIGNLFLYLV